MLQRLRGATATSPEGGEHLEVGKACVEHLGHGICWRHEGTDHFLLILLGLGLSKWVLTERVGASQEASDLEANGSVSPRGYEAGDATRAAVPKHRACRRCRDHVQILRVQPTSEVV